MLRPATVYPEILTSRKVCSLKLYAQLFYRNLMHVCDSNGVFENDPENLCRYLYPKARRWVTPEAITKWLLECHEAGLLRLYTDSKGRALGEFVDWLQKDKYPKRRFSKSLEKPPDELELFNASADPPAPARPQKGIELKRREGEGEGEGKAAAATTATTAPLPDEDTRPAADHLDELAARWPNHDLRACHARALHYRRSKYGPTSDVALAWFERDWMPHETERRKPPPPPPTPAAPPPTGNPPATVNTELRDALLKEPEPPADTFEHTLWEQARAAT